jgi:aminomethyltransferase
LWDALLEAGSPLGLIPAGLGARDTLRLEKGYCLYGNDIDEATSPLEAGLQWVVRLDKPFIGADALRAQKESGISRKLVGFMLEGRGIARAHCPIFVDEEKIGTVTSGNMSPMLKKAIGMAYVSVEHSAPGSRIDVEIRGRRVAAVVETLPFL